MTPRPAPRISIAIPYYAGLDYLREAIASVLAQTVHDWELLVVDDRGAVPAHDVVAGFDDPRIRSVLNDRNLGLAGNWNECVRRASAPLVTLLHADDRLLPGYVARVVAAADAHPDAAAVFTDARVIGPDGRPTTTLADVVKRALPRRCDDHLLAGDADLAGLLAGNYIVCPTLCLRVAALGDSPFDASLRFVPDWELTSRVLMEGGRLFAVRQELLEYRRHDSSETARQTGDATRFVEELAFLDRRAAEAERLGFPIAARTARRRITVRGHLGARAVLDTLAGRRTAARATWRLLRADLTRRPRS